MAKGRKTYPREYRERLVEMYRVPLLTVPQPVRPHHSPRSAGRAAPQHHASFVA